jgi:hypothetical protein
MLFRPLFMTAFLIDYFLLDEEYFGAQNIVLSSASSKTAMATAFLLSRNKTFSGQVIGLTSPGNVAFVKTLGCFDDVVTYETIDRLDASANSVFIDFAGNQQVLADVHNQLAKNLRYSCMVGVTHWDAPSSEVQAALPGPAPILFFAPDHGARRAQDWGSQGLEKRIEVAWSSFVEATNAWLNVTHGSGRDAVQRVYLDMLEGNATPDTGHIISMSAIH